MCGIVGYAGGGDARDVIIDGLKKLEYRGYDSSGIALCHGGKIDVKKCIGRIANLEQALSGDEFVSHVGIGHTRWATHGEPSDLNAHPHTDMDGTIAVVHNGIIENFVELREWLEKEHQVRFRSDTDTEVFAHLISHFYQGDLLDAVFKSVEKVRGSYGIAAICSKEPDRIVAVRKDSPLVVGLGEGGNFIASDIPALLKYARKIYLIENNETVLLTADDVKIFDAKRNQVKREVFHVTWDADAAEKEGYDHFMLKEIHEQPKAVRETLCRRLDDNDVVKLDGIHMSKEEIEGFHKVYIVACGTAYHAGLVGKYIIEKLAGIPVEVDIASEFRYRDPFVDDKTLLIAISQSGETLDTLAAMREAKKKGARILSVVNVVGSSVARESDDVFYTWAGPEIAVASTKAYTTQLVCMYLIALYMGRTRGVLTESAYRDFVAELKKIPEKMERILSSKEKIEQIARTLCRQTQVFFIGRGMDSSVCYEGSLKLKEISYINSFAIAAGELKHGTIALIEDGTPVIALATQQRLFEKMLSNIQEVKARGAFVVGVAKESCRDIEKQAEQVLYIPDCSDDAAPLLSVIPLQMLAYEIAHLRGCDIDKPKNLAKSVTVE